jgi:hypothetical protein
MILYKARQVEILSNKRGIFLQRAGGNRRRSIPV